MGGAIDEWGSVDDRESIAAIQTAIDRDVRLIDTAPVFGQGHSEEIVGKAIQGHRHEVLIATKCGLLPPARNGDPPRRCLTRSSILDECAASLRRLRVDVIDLYVCQWPDPLTPIRETMGALTELVRSGKIRAIGLSHFGVEEVAAAREFGPVHCVQAPLSMFHRRAASELLRYCREHDVSFLACTPLSKGLLTGKFDQQSKFNGLRARDPEFLGGRFRSNLRALDALWRIAERLGMSLTHMALAWTIAQSGVTAAIAGAKRPSQVCENADSASVVLSDETLSDIGQVLAERDSET